jgi:F0F1-type ATP synthase assembly protein I
MSGREQEPKKSAPPRIPNFLGRTRAMSSSGSAGWEATSIGFTLVGCIASCSGLGYWLDSHFKTNYWLPILFLVGVVAGFREMFVVLGRLNKEQEKKRLADKEKVQMAPTPPRPDTPPAEAPPTRERIFKVPPPPQAGQKPPEAKAGEPESVDELIERLLQDENDGNDESKSKR